MVILHKFQHFPQEFFHCKDKNQLEVIHKQLLFQQLLDLLQDSLHKPIIVNKTCRASRTLNAGRSLPPVVGQARATGLNTWLSHIKPSTSFLFSTVKKLQALINPARKFDFFQFTSLTIAHQPDKKSLTTTKSIGNPNMKKAGNVKIIQIGILCTNLWFLFFQALRFSGFSFFRRIKWFKTSNIIPTGTPIYSLGWSISPTISLAPNPKKTSRQKKNKNRRLISIIPIKFLA